MHLYHGSLVAVEKPRILPAEHIGDFGIGFYTTSDQRQALRFVEMKCQRMGVKTGVISEFEIPDDFAQCPDFQIKKFIRANDEWIDFVMANRRDVSFEHDYDVVCGPVANDQVYASFTLFENGIISRKELVERLKVRRLTDQYLFHTERSLTLLKFVADKEVPCSRK